MRATVADMVSSERRASAYGTLNAGYGFFWFVGSAVMGILYDISIPVLVAFSVIAQLGSIMVLAALRRR